MERLYRCLVLIVCLELLLLLAAPAQGQHYYQYQPPQVYHQQHYQQQYHYQYPAQKVIAQEIAVAPLIVTVPVESKAVPVHTYGNPYYYSTSDAYSLKASVRDVIREELRNLISGGNQPVKSSNGGGTQPKPSQPTQPVASNNKPVADTTTPVELQQQVLAAYSGRGNCLNCHSSSGASKFKLTMDDKGTEVLIKQTRETRWMIYGMASVGLMPPAAANDASKAMETQHVPNMLRYATQKD